MRLSASIGLLDPSQPNRLKVVRLSCTLWQMRCTFACAVLLLAWSTIARPAHAQDDFRRLHDLAAHATVRIQTRSALGTGWLLQQSSGRPVIVTNQHLIPIARGTVEVAYYQGSDHAPARGRARAVYVSPTLDLAVLVPTSDPPDAAVALELANAGVYRGERIVVGGNPNGLPFQTSEGVVTGHLPEHTLARRCGAGRNCIVVDAAAFAGSSGGPALNSDGRLVGMLWGGPEAAVRSRGRGGRMQRWPLWARSPTFAYLIHVNVLREQFARVRSRSD